MLRADPFQHAALALARRTFVCNIHKSFAGSHGQRPNMARWNDSGLSGRNRYVGSCCWSPRGGVLAHHIDSWRWSPGNSALARFAIFNRLFPNGALSSVETNH
eukprot:4756079-Pyramimonas_sp.AAC.1